MSNNAINKIIDGKVEKQLGQLKVGLDQANIANPVNQKNPANMVDPENMAKKSKPKPKF